MPCCCKSNVEAAFVLGIIFAILNIFGCFKGGTQDIVTGIIGNITLLFKIPSIDGCHLTSEPHKFL